MSFFFKLRILFSKNKFTLWGSLIIPFSSLNIRFTITLLTYRLRMPIYLYIYIIIIWLRIVIILSIVHSIWIIVILRIFLNYLFFIYYFLFYFLICKGISPNIHRPWSKKKCWICFFIMHKTWTNACTNCCLTVSIQAFT